MDGLDIPLDPPVPTAARDLLEKYVYGDGDVELILRFGEEHGLSKDSMVWLLTAILKVNTNLVVTLLRAIKATDDTIEKTSEAAKGHIEAAKALNTRLIAQMNQAAGTNVGKLDVVATRLDRLVNALDALGRNLAAAAKDHEVTRHVFKDVVGATDTQSALAALLDHVTRNAKLEAMHFVRSLLAEYDGRVRPRPWGLYAIGACQLVLTIAVIVLLRG